MLTREYAHTTRFSTALKRILEQVSSSDPFKGMRNKAFDHFMELGLPEKKQPPFEYVPMRLLYENNYFLTKPSQETLSKIQPKIKHELLPECQNSYVVFVNGFFTPELSDTSALPPSLVILPLMDAMRSYSTFLQTRWNRAIREEEDPLAVLNLATHPAGLFLYLPPKTQVETPIQAIFIEEQGEIYAAPRIQMFLASHSSLNWITTHQGAGHQEAGWSNTVLDFVLEDSATMNHTHYESGSGWSFNAVRGSLKRESSYNYIGGLFPSKIGRQSFKLSLQGEHSKAALQGLWILSENSQNHVHIGMDHAAPHTHSLQTFKGVLKDRSQSSFEGKIFVEKEALKTEAYQLNNNLILGDGALANSKPNLEIFADDVKASHGATVSKPDEDHLFYLRSRGLSLAEANSLLVRASCQEIADKISSPTLRKTIEIHLQ